MNNKILIAGSLAFDVIFSIPHDFRDSIPVKDGSIRNFNASYVAEEKNEFPGGNAGNIAFWLGKENIPSTIYSSWGKDFQQKGYEKTLKDLNINIVGQEGEFTANAYMVSDPLHQQFTIWQPNAFTSYYSNNLLDHFSKEDISSFEIAIFSICTGDVMSRYLNEFRSINKDALLIFDPGQLAHMFSKEEFQECLDLADIFVSNDVEFQKVKDYLLPEKIIEIETLGERGVIIRKPGEKEIKIEAIPVEKVVETTGAGDAFRSGLIKGLSQKLSLEDSARMGIQLGAQCVQLPSAQY